MTLTEEMATIISAVSLMYDAAVLNPEPDAKGYEWDNDNLLECARVKHHDLDNVVHALIVYNPAEKSSIKQATGADVKALLYFVAKHKTEIWFRDRDGANAAVKAGDLGPTLWLGTRDLPRTGYGVAVRVGGRT